MPPYSVTSLIIAGQTLTQSGSITVSSKIISLDASGTGIVTVSTITVGDGVSTVLVPPTAFTVTTVISGTTQIIVSIRPTRTTTLEGLPKFTSSSSTSIDSQTNTAVSQTTATTQTTASSPTFTPTPSQTALGPRAVAGIGIAAALGCLAIVGLIAYIFFRYGRRLSLTADDTSELMRLRSVAQLTDSKPDGIQELDGNERFELGVRRKRNRYRPVELEGS